ncbi:MAG TPA: hypothetical protein VL175_13625 [Pirellulales bacterium]|jgi:hypothetical protein|nr:hypothetical protein [Pirellulales bacterium]
MKRWLFVAVSAVGLLICDTNAFARGGGASGQSRTRPANNANAVNAKQRMKTIYSGKHAPQSDTRREEPAPLK